MNCEDVRERLPVFLAGGSEEADRSGIEEHLGGCPQCAGAVEMWNKLGTMPEERPSPALAARFESMLAAYLEGAEHGKRARKMPSFRGWLESWWPRNPALQFGIAAACLCMGLFAGYLATSGAGRRDFAEMREEVRSTRQLVAVSLLQQQSASERLRGVSYSMRVTQPDAEVMKALLHAVRYDTSVDVRISAVDALRRYSAEPSVRDGLLNALPAPQSPLVQIALIDLMVETRERRAQGVLQQLKDDKNVNAAVRERAGWGLERL